MKQISPNEMRTLDANCTYFGLLPLQLMENAGAALAHEARARTKGKRIAIVAGLGNNAGDAFVAARHLNDFDVTVLLLGRSRNIATEEARRNWEILERLSFDLREVRDPEELDLLSSYDMILDAIFGTGVHGTVRGLEAAAIESINSCGRTVISVDVPSGLGTNKTVEPEVTVTFHKAKPGIPGEVKVVSIGIPSAAELLVGPGDLGLIKSRSARSHKGNNGRVLVIGGGAYSGAPALSAMAALRAGADWVTVAAPSNVSKIVAGFSPNLIVRDLPGCRLSPDDVPILKKLIPRHDVVVVGMGLGRDPKTQDALAQLIPKCDRVVMDADALLPGVPLKGIITPHEAEFRRICFIEMPPGKIQREAIKNFARDMGVTILLKGKTDLITDGEILRVNVTGNAGMTVGGTGDVLAGITGAFYSKSSALQAAVAAAFVNGKAGDLAYVEKGFNLIATDVIENIPAAMRL
ncbi:MAG: NAD(P)H-hydrate dehydratase [Methanotrichaceae archaeon]